MLDAFRRISKHRGIEDTDTERHNEAAVDAILQLCRMGMVDGGNGCSKIIIIIDLLQTHHKNDPRGFLEVLTPFYGKLPRCFITSRKRRCS